MEVPLLAYLVLQEAAVRLFAPLWQVAEENECRNDSLLKHGHIFDFDKFTFVARRGCDGDLLQHVCVELRGGYNAPSVLLDLYSGFENFENTLFGERGGEDNREVGERCEL